MLPASDVWNLEARGGEGVKSNINIMWEHQVFHEGVWKPGRSENQ